MTYQPQPDKYPQADTYQREDGEGWDGERKPCTCKPTCVQPCKGVCGCEVCEVAYADFLSCE